MRTDRPTPGHGTITFPAVPSLVDEFLEQVLAVFSVMNRPAGGETRQRLREALLIRLEEAFEFSPHSTVTFKYTTVRDKPLIMNWRIKVTTLTVEDDYEAWVEKREPPLFGEDPPARLKALLGELGRPAEVHVLDVGAGTGRNTLALARLGYPVVAVESSALLADILDSTLSTLRIAARIVRGDFSNPTLRLPRETYRLVLLTDVCQHLRNAAELGMLLRRVTEVLEPSGVVLLNLFLTEAGYKPDRLVREVAEVSRCLPFQREELDAIVNGLPMQLESEADVFDFEQSHPETWPPTPWYPAWVTGKELFEKLEGSPPIRSRWFVYRRK